MQCPFNGLSECIKCSKSQLTDLQFMTGLELFEQVSAYEAKHTHVMPKYFLDCHVFCDIRDKEPEQNATFL